jgi:hypothetical protein
MIAKKGKFGQRDVMDRRGRDRAVLGVAVE